MESMKMAYSEVMILKVYEWNTWIKHSIWRSSEVMILKWIQSASVEYIYWRENIKSATEKIMQDR